jgi:cytoskeletal protein RodZ
MEPAGERLKKIRLEKGISLEEVRKRTKVNLRILEALEGDSLTDLSPVYLKGFLKIYCNFLGVDPRDYIADYKEAQSVIKDIDTAEYVLRRPEKPASFFKTASIKLSSFRPTKKFRALFIFIAIIIAISFGLFNLGRVISSRRRVRLTPEKGVAVVTSRKEDTKKQKPKAVAPGIAKPQAAKAEPKKETAAGIRLIIRARENCWVYLKADGRVLFQRVLEKGRFETWQAKEKIELSLGNAGAVELEVNGQLFLNLGRRGQARKNIVITKEGLNIGR